MSIYYRFNNFNSNAKISSNFKYNYYEKDEGATIDTVINSNLEYSTKEITINLKYKAGYSKSNQFISSYINEIDKQFFNKNKNKLLSEEDLAYFNNLTEKKQFIEKNSYFDSEDVKSYNESLNENLENHFEAFERLSISSKKINVNRKKSSLIKSLNRSNIFLDEKVFEENDFYFLNKEESRQTISEKNNFLSNLKSYNKKSIYECQNTYFFHAGILVIKYVKTIEGNYKKISNKFIVNSDLENLRNNFQFKNEKSYTVFDDAIKYGKTYRYLLYPVFNITMPSYNDFHMLDDYLYCDIPLDTKDIVCKETDRPFPPSYINFSIKENKVNIQWLPENDGTGDVKGFQIFKRQTLDEPFQLVKQIEYHLESDVYSKNNLVLEELIEKRNEGQPFEYYDKLEKDKIVIYAICAIDAHGQVSNYSSQIAIKYNFFNKHLETDLVSTPGAPLFYPNIFIKRKTKFIDNDDKIVTITPIVENISKITLYATPDFAIINNDSVSLNNNYTYKEKYKFNIFKVENSKNFIDDIDIENFKN
tara:strand:+ start:12130 stop:13728 length:1599 start_codon:yes stop_codon:yes gene_type:complete